MRSITLPVLRWELSVLLGRGDPLGRHVVLSLNTDRVGIVGALWVGTSGRSASRELTLETHWIGGVGGRGRRRRMDLQREEGGIGQRFPVIFPFLCHPRADIYIIYTYRCELCLLWRRLKAQAHTAQTLNGYACIKNQNTHRWLAVITYLSALAADACLRLTEGKSLVFWFFHNELTLRASKFSMSACQKSLDKTTRKRSRQVAVSLLWDIRGLESEKHQNCWRSKRYL